MAPGTRSWLAAAPILGLLAACNGSSTELPPPPPPPADGAFVHADGRELRAGDAPDPIHLRGVAFDNWFWRPEVSPSHHDERDLARVHDMGMNVVRFFLNAAWLEDPAVPGRYRPGGWKWIDRNILWARAHGIRLVLDLQVPFGGYQSDRGGLPFWTVPDNQRRFVALWKAIASRYRDDPTIAGFDLLNEPMPPDSAGQWKRLAQETLDAIRTVDPNHLVVVERILGLHGQLPTYDDVEASQVLVDDPAGNVMYDFHFYLPLDYTHQNSWIGFPEGGSYPDASRPVVSPLSLTGMGSADQIAAGTTGWTSLAGTPLPIRDAAHVIAVPGLVAFGVRDGTVSFDGLVVKEYDPEGGFVRDVAAAEIEGAAGWQLFTDPASGSLAVSTASPHAGTAAIVVTGTTGRGAAYDTRLAFVPREGYRYGISGWVKGTRIPAGATAGLALLLFANPTGAPIPARDAAYLEAELLRLLAFREQHQVPMNVGEFGLYRDCFEDGRGGLQWVEDVLDLLLAHDLSFTYYTYHQPDFGIYHGDGGLPDPADSNEPLIDLLTRKLNGG